MKRTAGSVVGWLQDLDGNGTDEVLVGAPKRDSNGTNAGGLYDVAVEWLEKPNEKLVAKAFKPGNWNTMTIKAVGRDITVWLNGHQMSSINNDRSERGRLGVQLHAGEDTQIKLKNIRITEL